MNAIYGTKISDNMTRTPEGYLVCHNVPIAGAWEYEYMPSEIGMEGIKPVKVYREADEVFHPSAMASFEGMVVTDDHPKEEVNSGNAVRYARGHARNIRQVEDMLVGDLLIFDSGLINMIESGKRDISCGYSCEYIQDDDGRITQKKIRGNHIAVVQSGRAGDRVRINDRKMERRTEPMKNKNFWSMFQKAAKDASPEELAEMASMAPKDETPQEQAQEVSLLETMAKKIAELEAKIDAMIESDKQVHAELPKAEEPDQLDELETELEKAEPTEADPESLKVIDADEDKEEEVFESKDSAKAMLKTMKPIIAAIKDPAERKRASDALAVSIRKTMKETPSVNTVTNGYAFVNKASAKDNATIDPASVGKAIMEKHNANYVKK